MFPIPHIYKSTEKENHVVNAPSLPSAYFADEQCTKFNKKPLAVLKKIM